MSTSKVLQKPSISKIVGSTIFISHPDTEKYTQTWLADKIAAAGTTMSVYDNNNFIKDDWFIVGTIGDSKTEEDNISNTVTRGQTIPVSNTLSFNHELDAPVIKIRERGIRIYGAATNGGAGTLVASVDAITTPIADAVMIQWNRLETQYTLLSTDTHVPEYAYYYVKFTDGTTDSVASDYVSVSGMSSASASYIIDAACQISNTDVGEGMDLDWLVTCVNDAKNAIKQYTQVNPVTGKSMSIDWDFEITKDTSLTITENKHIYDLTSLLPKYPNSKAIIGVQIGDRKQLEKMTPDEMDTMYFDKPYCLSTVQALVGDTTLTVDNNIEFDTSGAIYLGSEIITYTGKSGTTQFTGIPASGTGSIAAIHAAGSYVWQNIAPSEPEFYTVEDYQLKLNCPPDGDYASYPIKIRYYSNLGAILEPSDVTPVTFYNAIQFFVAGRIETRRQNWDKAKEYMKEFDRIVQQNVLKRDNLLKNKKKYYTYTNDY
jgi:hypothetical protein